MGFVTAVFAVVFFAAVVLFTAAITWISFQDAHSPKQFRSSNDDN